MTEHRFWQGDQPPEYHTAAWHATRDRARHLEEDAHRPRLDMAYELVMFALNDLGPGHDVVDLGCGDGGLLSLLDGRDVDCWGYDFTPANVAGAHERGVSVRERDFTIDPIRWASVVVMTETLEHLYDPHGMLARVADNTRWLVASSPWQETPGNHTEYHLWGWDVDGYATMIDRAGFDIPRHETVAGFQVVAARSRGSL